MSAISSPKPSMATVPITTIATSGDIVYSLVVNRYCMGNDQLISLSL
jgi:hypothetical protein